MFIKRKIIVAVAFMLLVSSFAAPSAKAGGNEYKAIVKHLKERYRAKKVNIPMIWLARFAVSAIRPAGVQSFSLTLFENLQFSPATLDMEMQSALRNSFDAEWIPVFRVRSRDGQQVYMYMREEGKSVKIMLVTIEKNQAAVIRAKFNPDKLVDFINDPKIFGISLNDNQRQPNVEISKQLEKLIEKK